MLLEYTLPFTSKRADVIFAGDPPAHRGPVVCRGGAEAVEQRRTRGRRTAAVPGGGVPGRPGAQPDRVRYGATATTSIDFNGALSETRKRVSGVAYLHNATEFGVGGLYEVEQSERGRLFTGERRGEFLAYLGTRLAAAPGAAAADELLAGRIAPSRQLMAVAARGGARAESSLS